MTISASEEEKKMKCNYNKKHQFSDESRSFYKSEEQHSDFPKQSEQPEGDYSNLELKTKF